MSQSQKVLLQYERKPRPGHLNRQGGGRNLIPDDMTQRMGVGIQEFHQSRHQYLLNAAELVAFSNFVDYIIRNEMVLFCEAAPDIEPMRRIKLFVDQYDFSDDDCNEQTLRQAYLRHRRNIKASSFSVHVGRQLHFHPLELAA
ncbi:hypothetical protein [Spirosoma sordidisoli]|uniref:Uncharacterized protein n=1 Tax=Spirosoma sordidisoli TaxID=2502893 RepID=A0A4Q2UQ60_9BACT|nr:hypothetical protein [Spirosoma sordidisoli]RYC69785.1 hypothetical protein EQG79_14415 [Spirosoma sordidisoli]